MPEITCRWCKQKYIAHNDTRKHCRAISCRNEEITYNLNLLVNYIDMILRHRIVAEIEIRCPGNDTLGRQVKIKSKGYINDSVITNNVRSNKKNKAVELNNLRNYFKHILQKGIKGNFIIKTLAEGIIENIILNESFGMLDKPVVFGNNLLIIQQKFNKGGI